jgi:transcriptional regulator with XRE-family HTH domain
MTGANEPHGQIGRVPPRKANAIDAHVGMRLRLRRTLLGIRQEDLAQMLGITFQQVQKYESGDNRISASRLFQLSVLLDVPVAWFFDGASLSTPAIGEAGARPIKAPELSLADAGGRKDLALLCRYFEAIADPRLRRKLVAIARVLADVEAPNHA